MPKLGPAKKWIKLSLLRPEEAVKHSAADTLNHIPRMMLSAQRVRSGL
jgi:hypothetical protein